MSDAVTRATIRGLVKQRLDLVDSDLIAEATLNSWIDDSISELYDLLVEARGEDYYTTKAQFVTVADTSDYALNTICGSNNFYKLRGIYLVSGSDRLEMERLGLNEMITFSARTFRSNGWTSTCGHSGVAYCIFGDTLRFAPTPTAVYTCEVWYIPPFTGLASDGATFDAINGWHEYVVADMCIKCAYIDGADPSVFMQQKQTQAGRIAQQKINRDQYKVYIMRNSERYRRRYY